MVSLRRGGVPGPVGSDSLDAARRARELAALAEGEAIDVLVVGGGIVGTWAALDAASRGFSVALVERGDLAQGTSRWSSKLAHGGLRYLAHGDVGVAWESARERAILMDVSAPHLIRALPMLVPLGGQVGRAAGATLETGLRLGDALRAAAGTSRRRLPPARRVSAEEARRLAPGLSDRELRGALLHWDGQIEDDARLVLAIARTAAAHGARILTYVSAGVLRTDGATVHDEHGDGGTSGSFELRARHVVNATGVWAGELSGGAVRLRPSKGSHLLVPAAAVGEPRAAVNAPLPGGGSRFVFAVPRPDGLVLIGITDAPFDGAIPDVPTVDADEEAFLLTSIGRVLERTPTREDVVGRFAGLRPLLANDSAGEDGVQDTADLSRRHAVVEHDGVVTVVGGKLTTARRMAQDALDRVAARPGATAAPCVTHRIRLTGADRPDDARSAPLALGVPASRAQLRFAVEHELALTADDLLDRRTRLGLVPQWRAAALDAAHEALAATAPAT
ncbi:MAG TPA: glycerol-3-phosphate dehydrogenase/oxidase [Conexibacter sp.]|jgi:glycerol-3-phosphate dehydrogenase|nr:glycerol-3-phosphate dehydrogenase/oxidase [Conexibacter sp.]